MQDTGEDALRQRPNVVATFFKRLGQVHMKGFSAWLTDTFQLKLDLNAQKFLPIERYVCNTLFLKF